MTAARHIAIVGYGTAGQALALLLARLGIQVQVFERAEKPGPVGAGLLLQPTGMSVLAEMGLLEAVLDCGARISCLRGDTVTGRKVIDLNYADLFPHWFGLGIQRGALFEVMHRAQAKELDLRCGHAVTAIDFTRTQLQTDDGQWHGPFDLIVLADGAHSGLREGLSVVKNSEYPWGAFWCLLDDPKRHFQNTLQQKFHSAHTFAGVLPVGRLSDDDIQTHRLGLFWSLPVARFEHVRALPIEHWKQSLGAHWPELSPLLAPLRQWNEVANARYRHAMVHPCVKGRVVCVGDSAHAMSPQLGQGANMALMDAWALSCGLQVTENWDNALLRYQNERRTHRAIYQKLSRWLTPFFQSDSKFYGGLRDLFFHRFSKLPMIDRYTLQVLCGVQNGYLGGLPKWVTAAFDRRFKLDEDSF